MAEICTIKLERVEAATSSQSNESTMDINNHPDTAVLGSDCLPVHDLEILVDVPVCDASSGSVKCPTISGAIAYYHPISGQVYVLVYYQAIRCPRLANHLICLMQSRMAGFRINYLQKILVVDPNEKTHAIIFDDPLNPNEPLIIMLLLNGVGGYFLSRKPRASEYEDDSIPHIDMTSKAPVWEPSETSFVEQEYVMTNFRGQVISSETITRGRRIINSLSTGEYDAVDFTDDDNFFNALDVKVNVSRDGSSKGRHDFT